MRKSDLHPPISGPGADPVLYGVAAGLAELFPPVPLPAPPGRDAPSEPESAAEERAERD